jgi:pimeloyl-ACP methyl ester carboxylesterase
MMMRMSEVTKSEDGIPIHFEVVGAGIPALVFVHGWCCDRSYWKEQVAHFASSHTVVTLDLAGHGESGTGRKHYTIPQFGRDVAAVVEQLNLQQVILIGHSMGGPVIVEAARCIPSRVLGLIGADTWWDVSEIRSDDVVDERMAPFHSDFVSAAQSFVRSMFVPNSDPTLVERIVGGMTSASPAVAINALTEVVAGDELLRDGFRALKAPRVAINADGWRPTNMEAAKAFGIDVKIMSGVGHFLMLEDPRTFNRLVDDAVVHFGGRS